MGSETQNNNESLNSLIWTFAPKHIHARKKTIEIANYLAVYIFNEGFLPILKIMSVMGIAIGPEAHALASKRDETRGYAAPKYELLMLLRKIELLV